MTAPAQRRRPPWLTRRFVVDVVVGVLPATRGMALAGIVRAMGNAETGAILRAEVNS